MAAVFTAACGVGETTLPENGVAKLRAEPKTLSEDDVKSLLKSQKFYDKRWHRSGGGFPNRFELKATGDQPVVMDQASGLTWHQSGSDFAMIYEDIPEWLEQLNTDKYGGYSDWRLPTLEEALTLMEPKARDRFYIDPLFSKLQFSMWTADDYTEVRVWAISFNYGRVFKALYNETDFVRPVR